MFLDEINTAQYPGLMKEIIIDRTFHGMVWFRVGFQYSKPNGSSFMLYILQPLPSNLFIIAACNPHRGHSLVTHEPRENIDNWIKGTYYVNKLHPSIQCLIWKYGALDERQEHKYIHEKMAVISKEKDRDERYIYKQFGV